MENLKTTHNLVKRILEQIPETRNSDVILYYRVAEHIGLTKGVDILSKPFGMVLCDLKKLGLPTIDSVGRARRKVQEQYPHLQGKKKVKDAREVLELEYRKYARGIF